jgi:D-cysteine desulfhydrase
MERTPLKLKLYEIKDRISQKKVELVNLPSRIDFHKDLSAELGFNFFLKRDDILGLYGGNKPRKLEFIFKQIRDSQKKDVFIFGPTGSHHILANLIYAKDFFQDIKFTTFVFPTYLWKWGDVYVRENTELAKKLSFRFVFVPTSLHAFIISKVLATIRKGFFVPAGSTSEISSLGFVLAAIEIKEDVLSGKIPEPDFIFLPVGTMGTLVGLSCGLAICEMRTKILGCAVVEKILCNEFLAKKLINKLIKVLKEILNLSSLTKIKESAFSNFSIIHSFLGRGYGYPSDEGIEAMRFFSKYMKVEKTYTAKTLAAILAKKDEFKNKNVLFYCTLNSLPMNFSKFGK